LPEKKTNEASLLLQAVIGCCCCKQARGLRCIFDSVVAVSIKIRSDDSGKPTMAAADSRSSSSSSDAMWTEVEGIRHIARAKEEKCYREYSSQYRLHDCDLMMQFNQKK